MHSAPRRRLSELNAELSNLISPEAPHSRPEHTSGAGKHRELTTPSKEFLECRVIKRNIKHLPLSGSEASE